MKRWWITSKHPAPARSERRRLGRALARVVMAGAVSMPLALPIGDQVLNPRQPRTGGAVIEAWAFGTLSGATHPNSQEACDFEHVCALAISSAGGSGTGTGTTIKTSFQSPSQVEPPPNLPFNLTETIDYNHPVSKGVHGAAGGGACFPALAVMSISVDGSSTLVLDIVGQACQVGNTTAQVLLTGSYVVDTASSGTVSNADGVGSVSVNSPSGLPGSGTTMKASLLGQLIYGN